MRGQTRFVPLCILLGLTLAIELATETLISAKLPFVWLYHLYVVVEYGLLCIYFSYAAYKFRRPIFYSIPVFIIVSTSISYWLYSFNSFPGVNINTSGFVISIICTYVMFNLETESYSTISRHPDFWICCGLLAFFGGTFFSNGLYTYLQSLDRDQALQLFSVINKPLNIILYSCLIIGFIWAIPRRSSIPSS